MQPIHTAYKQQRAFLIYESVLCNIRKATMEVFAIFICWFIFGVIYYILKSGGLNKDGWKKDE